eukprot:TRINITY_DN3326_c4_g2_i2.p2 TRINITY_DN3326_c4_g2~~TRINITY_DN3326_c4_g2_i2.p2  ORF type:complete len:64 (+),score=23.77 TRINITY_DN3326_c4_g2_i2:122-313(+)
MLENFERSFPLLKFTFQKLEESKAVEHRNGKNCRKMVEEPDEDAFENFQNFSSLKESTFLKIV